MNKRFRVLFRQFHLWIGLTSGILIFIISITGSIYVFSEEIKKIIDQDQLKIDVSSKSTRISLTELASIAEATFNHQYDFQNIFIPNFPNQPISVIFQKTNEGSFGYPNYMEFYKTVYLNPYTGEIVKTENTKWEFFNVVFWIHTTLFMGHNEISNYVIVLTVWVFIISLISGIVLWWPKSTKGLKYGLKFNWKRGEKWKRKNLDLHKVLGFYACLIGLIFALTGLLWASKSFNTSIKWLANGGGIIIEEELPDTIKDKVKKPLDEILSQVLKNIPHSKYILIREHPNEKVPYIVRSYVDETVNFTRIEMYYDKKSAELLLQEEFSSKNNGEKIQMINYDLHVGTIGGLPTKILAFVMSLVIASLPITGFLFWLGRKKMIR